MFGTKTRLTMMLTMLGLLMASVAPLALASSDGPGITPDAAIEQLKEGNQRFHTGESNHPRADAQRMEETAENGQNPFATVITCSDSRVPVERVFDQGIGDIFTIRVAGNVCDTDEIGSIEYGIDHLGTPVMVVLGHSGCGAVTAVVTGAELHGSIPPLVDNIGPAVEKAKLDHPDTHGKDLVPAAVEANVWQSIDDLFKRSPATRKRVEAGTLKVIGAVYHLDDGKVEWLGEPSDLDRLLAYTSGPSHADAHAPADLGPRPETPADALTALQEGNHRFAAGENIHGNLDDVRRNQTATEGQHPFATVIACSDSRVPVESVFDRGVGDIFTIRVAGNVCDTDEIGSIEYGVDHLGTPLMVVLGHTGCGAVTAVVTGAELHGSIPSLVDNIGPAVEKAKHDHPDTHGKDLVPAAVEANVWQSIDDLFKSSPATRKLVKAGTLQVVGAVYDLGSGEVKWLGEHPEAAKLAAYTGGPSHAETHAPADPGPRPTNPDEALHAMQAGNERYASDTPIHPFSDKSRRHDTAGEQHPFATVITCSDSRVPVERVFDQGIGDIFTIRVAGNVCDVDEVGSIEYGVDHLGTPLFVVLGHTGCGAVTAVVTGAELHGSIPPLVDNIIPAVEAAQHAHPNTHGKDLVPAAVEANVWQS
ncbi:MAG: carbonic anhydrase, partial [Thermoguttaceae bacterium]